MQPADILCAEVLEWDQMMKNDYEIIHYGHEDSEVECAEHVKITTNDDLLKAYGTYDWKKEFFKHNTGDHAHQTLYQKAEIELNKRVQQGDLTIFREHNPKVIIRKYSWRTLPKSISEVTI